MGGTPGGAQAASGRGFGEQILRALGVVVAALGPNGNHLLRATDEQATRLAGHLLQQPGVAAGFAAVTERPVAAVVPVAADSHVGCGGDIGQPPVRQGGERGGGAQLPIGYHRQVQQAGC